MAVTPTVPVAVAAGADAWEAAQDLRGVPGLHLATSPRHAAVLVVAGTIPADDREALYRVHDQVPRPRGVVAWRPALAAADIPAHVVDDGVDAVLDAARAAQAAVLADPARGADDLLPDTEPNEWRGVGPFGQGGEGMMGGTPYGRPMTMTGDDRDGLALDQLELTLGPFLDPLPGGCSLAVTLQGEVLQQVELVVRASDGDAFGCPVDGDLHVARRALRRTAHGLHVAGLDALASRAAVLARRVSDGADRAPLSRDARGLRRRIGRSGLLWTLRGVGTIDGHDAAARWRARLDLIHAALDGDADRTSSAPPDHTSVEAALTGVTVTDAMATLASVDAWQRRPVGAGAS